MDDVQGVIERAWEERDAINSATRGEIRDAVDHALAALDGGSVRVAEKTRRGLAHQSVAEEGCAPVLPSQRHDGDSGRARRGAMVGQGAFEVRGLERERFRKAGFRAVPGCAGPALGLYRAGRDPDAVLRQSRRLCRQRDHGRYLGDGRVMRPDRQELSSLGRRRHRRRARAAAGRSGDHRGQLLHRGALRSRRGRAWSARDRCCRWGSISALRRRIIDRATGEVFYGQGAALFGGGVGNASRQAAAGQRARVPAFIAR